MLKQFIVGLFLCAQLILAQTQTTPCGAGTADCDGRPGNGCEINLMTSKQNCGACGIPCSAPNGKHVAQMTCVAGKCIVSQCNNGFYDADGDPSNGCESTTPPAFIGPHSSGSTPCPPGKADCDSKPGNLCETNLVNDNRNCGACGSVCIKTPQLASLHVESVDCVSGRCIITACSRGFFDVDGIVSNGCESTTLTTAPPALTNQPLNCPSGMADCNAKASDGCEVNLMTDLMNCGSCGHPCIIPSGVHVIAMRCDAGRCRIAQCEAGFTDADGNIQNGCESGPAQQQTTITRCPPNMADCDGNSANGCEINITTNLMHCGACGQRCTVPVGALHVAAMACNAGTCMMICESGFFDRDGNFQNGCESTTRR